MAKYKGKETLPGARATKKAGGEPAFFLRNAPAFYFLAAAFFLGFSTATAGMNSITDTGALSPWR